MSRNLYRHAFRFTVQNFAEVRQSAAELSSKIILKMAAVRHAEIVVTS